MNFSYWETQFISRQADLVILGAGITGLSAAFFASQRFPKWKIIVLEKFTKHTAASTRNAGFACFGSAGELMDDLSIATQKESVFNTLKMRVEGLSLLKETLGESKISYRPSGGIELFTEEQTKEFAAVSGHITSLNSEIEAKTGLKNTFSETNVPSSLSGFKNAISNAHEGKLNPGEMMLAWRALCEANGVEMLYGSEAKMELGSKEVYIKNHKIRAEQIAVCTNGLTQQLGLNLDVKPARNLILLTKPLAEIVLPSTYHHLKGYMYFRKIHDRILLGGGRHLFKHKESSSEFHVNPEVRAHLISYFNTHFGITESQIEQEWTGIMGVSESKESIIKRLDEQTVCGVKLGGMGVAIGTSVGKKISELL